MVEAYEWKYRHFRPEEFECSCDRCRGKNTGYKMEKEFMGMIEDARMYAGTPFNVTGYRCKEHNAEIPGSSKTSEHCNGRASDVSYKTSAQCWKIVKGLIEAGFTRIKIYKKKDKSGWVHCDTSKSSKKPNPWMDVKEV